MCLEEWYMKNRDKAKRIIILTSAFFIIFVTAFVFTDLKLYIAIKLKLIITIDPTYQYGSEICIEDDYIIISTRLRKSGHLGDECCYLACVDTAAEMTEYMYALSLNEFWRCNNRSVYIECGHRGGGGLAPVESGIGCGMDGTEYSDGYMSTNFYRNNGRCITLRYCYDEDIMEKCTKMLSLYKYDKIYIE